MLILTLYCEISDTVLFESFLILVCFACICLVGYIGRTERGCSCHGTVYIDTSWGYNSWAVAHTLQKSMDIFTIAHQKPTCLSYIGHGMSIEKSDSIKTKGAKTKREKWEPMKSKQLKLSYSEWQLFYLLATHGNIYFVLFLILFLGWFLI